MTQGELARDRRDRLDLPEPLAPVISQCSPAHMSSRPIRKRPATAASRADTHPAPSAENVPPNRRVFGGLLMRARSIAAMRCSALRLRRDTVACTRDPLNA